MELDDEEGSEYDSENEKVDEEDERSDDNQDSKDEDEDKVKLRQMGLDETDQYEEETGKGTSIKNIEKINGFWLQTEINKYFDLSVVLKLEKEILKILPSGDKRECENKLVLLLSQ